MRRTILICIALAAATLAAYMPLARNGFVNYDDPDYVSENQIVKNGLTLAGSRWAFTTFAASNWHPLTWLSHMLDCQLWDLNAAAHHLMSLAMHTASTVLLFLTLRGMTGSTWPRAWAAAV